MEFAREYRSDFSPEEAIEVIEAWRTFRIVRINVGPLAMSEPFHMLLAGLNSAIRRRVNSRQQLRVSPTMYFASGRDEKIWNEVLEEIQAQGPEPLQRRLSGSWNSLSDQNRLVDLFADG